MEPLSRKIALSTVQRPSRYVGNEIHAVHKDAREVEVTVALAFPDVYEIGMSHLGLKILYHILNEHPWIAAERVFAPWVDFEKQLRDSGRRLTTLESRLPLAELDVVGFSLQYELTYTNLLTMLNLSGIPFLAKDRTPAHPLIIAGGPACFNPEPMASFLDAVVIGDGESAVVEICTAIREKKEASSRERQDLLLQLARIPGVYIPGFFRDRRDESGRLLRMEALQPGYDSVRKATVPDIDRYPFPTNPVVPYTELIHDRYAVEITRGCTRGCRFCQAGMIYRPVRERSPRRVLQAAETGLHRTGYEELSLLSLSSGDYTCIEPLLHRLMDMNAQQKIAVSLPSLRVDTLTPRLMAEIKRVRKTGFTLAPEAGSERLRRAINKGLTRSEILDMARDVYAAGWNLIKLYFMIGLPSETDDDIDEMIRLVRDVVRLAPGKGKRAKLHVSLSTFIPKPHTPFMWAAQLSTEQSRRRIESIRSRLRDTRIRIKWNLPVLSRLEGIFSRGDRRLAAAVAEAWSLGARFDGWSDQFQPELWDRAFARTGVDPSAYLRERTLDEPLPWDHIHSGVSREFLQRERENALQEQLTPDCRTGCINCGVCDGEALRPVIHPEFPRFQVSSGQDVAAAVGAPEKMPPPRIRIYFTKLKDAAYLSHLELGRVFLRAFRRAGIPLVHSRGFHPMPKISFAEALPVGMESLWQVLETEPERRVDPNEVRHRLNEQLPTGIRIRRISELRMGKKKGSIHKETHYFVRVNGHTMAQGPIDDFMKAGSVFVMKKGKKGLLEVDARPMVRSMNATPSGIRLVLTPCPGPSLRPDHIVAHIFRMDSAEIEKMSVLKLKERAAGPSAGAAQTQKRPHVQ